MTVKKYIKKPIPIEAIQYEKNNKEVIKNIYEFVTTDDIYYNDETDSYYIKTLEGDMKCADGCYIIKGINGEFYPCKKEIFEVSYKEVK